MVDSPNPRLSRKEAQQEQPQPQEDSPQQDQSQADLKAQLLAELRAELKAELKSELAAELKQPTDLERVKAKIAEQLGSMPEESKGPRNINYPGGQGHMIITNGFTQKEKANA
jgi:hypothetical protein